MREFDFAPVREHYRKWWTGEDCGPIVSLTFSGRDPGRPKPDLPPFGFQSFYDLSVSPKQLIERWDYELDCTEFCYDAFPIVPMQFFGPGAAAAFMGATPHPAPHTVWFDTPKPLPLRELHFEFRDDTVWYRRLKAIYETGLEYWRGNVLMQMTDLGGALDILASFRGTENLLMDLIEEPQEVERCVRELHEAWYAYFDDLNPLLKQGGTPGYSYWAGMYSEQPSYIFQCDFCYMIGPEMFSRFVLPELHDSFMRLPNAAYHLDGIGQLPHLDKLLAEPALKCVQWVPGSGEPERRDWSAVYRRIAEAGKRIYCWGDLAFFDYMTGVIDRPGLLYLSMGFEHSKRDEVLRHLAGRI